MNFDNFFDANIPSASLTHLSNNVPILPKTSVLTMTHRECLDELFAKVRPMISEFSFAGIFLFAEVHSYEISSLENIVIFLGKDKMGKFIISPFASPSEKLLDYARNEGYYFKIVSDVYKADLLSRGNVGANNTRSVCTQQNAGSSESEAANFEQNANFVRTVPKKHAKPMPTDPRHTVPMPTESIPAESTTAEFAPTESTTSQIGNIRLVSIRGDYDYIYARKDLELLAGRKFHKKRNLVNAFLKTYPNHHSEKICLENLVNVQTVLDLWEEKNKSLDTQDDNDYLSIKKAIAHFEQLKIFGRISYVENNPVGFVIGELTHEGFCCVIHFEKANDDYVGVYQYINNDFAKSLPENCGIINREQDMGKIGLRQAKETYRPRALLRKHRVFLETFLEAFGEKDDHGAHARK